LSGERHVGAVLDAADGMPEGRRNARLGSAAE
jgi:hypothetical protein